MTLWLGLKTHVKKSFRVSGMTLINHTHSQGLITETIACEDFLENKLF